MATRKKRKRKSDAWLFLLILLVGGLSFGLGFFSGRSVEGRSTASEAESDNVCTVRYLIDGSVYDTETVAPGGELSGIGYPSQNGRTVVAWLDGNGRETEIQGLRAYMDLTFTAVMAPQLRQEQGYMACPDGLFRPESPLTRLEAAELFCGLLVNTPEGGGRVTDMSADAAGYQAADAMVTADLMSAPSGIFSPAGTFTEDAFSALLEKFFRAEDVAPAVGAIRGIGDETVTRAEAAVCLNRLLGLPGEETEAGGYFPDVEENYWASQAVRLAGQPGKWRGRSGRLAEGFTNVDGYLYYVQEDGSFLKNAYIGSLYFDNNGRYTSGDRELDAYVAAAIRENTEENMDREEMLRAMYLYVRDGFEYLRRNHYNTGDRGWALKEALTMYATGRGNCYCYAAAFWAAARGLGYDAMVVSGTIGTDVSPHGWVEIPMDGGRYVFDVEIEMAYRRDGKVGTDMFKMEHVSARYSWLYAEYNEANHLATPESSELFRVQ